MAFQIAPNYNLSDQGLDNLERWASRITNELAPNKDLVGLVVPSNSPLANFGRTTEQRIFTGLGEDYDFSCGMLPHEGRSTFMYTVDQRPILEKPRIAHVKRIVAPFDDLDGVNHEGLTGIEMVDDRLRAIEPEEHMELKEILDESALTLEALQKSLCVATNFITHRVEKGKDLGALATAISYHFLVKYAHEKGTKAIIAYQNNVARYSIGKLGAESYVLGGKDFHLPKTTGGYDNDYVALVIPDSEQNLGIFLGKHEKSRLKMILGAVSTELVEHTVE